MFKHTLIEKKEIDLDQLVRDMKTKPEVVNYAIQIFGSIEYSFIIKCVEDQVEKIKKNTPMPIEGKEVSTND